MAALILFTEPNDSQDNLSFIDDFYEQFESKPNPKKQRGDSSPGRGLF